MCIHFQNRYTIRIASCIFTQRFAVVQPPISQQIFRHIASNGPTGEENSPISRHRNENKMEKRHSSPSRVLFCNVLTMLLRITHRNLFVFPQPDHCFERSSPLKTRVYSIYSECISEMVCAILHNPLFAFRSVLKDVSRILLYKSVSLCGFRQW